MSMLPPRDGEPLPETITVDRPPPVASESATIAPSPAAVGEAAAMPSRMPPGYEVLGELGRGGMGVVYKARQIALDRIVALKMILHADHAGPEDRARFQVEAEAVARLQHPHIVQVFDIGEVGGLPYLSLEFCPGGSLESKLNGTPLPAEEAARLMETLARAIEAAHRAYLVHRDLKPANVLLTADGEPKITDFGLAKKLDVQGQTRSGAVMGTPSYMAPEQAGGQKNVGPATDVYALGALLYELLTGRPPFKAATPLDTIMQVVSDEPVSVRRLQPQVPFDLETICLKCLQKQPARRYASAAALAEDLRRFRAGEPIAARPVGRWERGWRWCRRNPMAAGLSAALLLLLIAAAIGSTAAAIHLNWISNEARHNADLADEARQIAEAHKAQARYNQYVAEMNLVQRDYETNNIGHFRELLEAQIPREGDAKDLRGFEWHYWHRLAQRELLALKEHTEQVSSVVYSPDGRRLASGSSDGTVRVWDSATGKELRTLTGHTADVAGVSFSPDGRRLASASYDQTVRVWDASTGEKQLVLKGHTAMLWSVAFSPDGRRLASTSADQTVRIWDAGTGKELLKLAEQTGFIRGVSFSRDGQRLATGGSQTARIWNPANGEKILDLKGHTGDVLDVAFSPDSRWLATASDDQTVRVWDAATGKLLHTLLEHTDSIRGVSFSSDSRRLATASEDQTVRVWDAATGKELLSLKGHTGPIYGVSFSPDGRRLATASEDRTIRIWDAITDSEQFIIRGHKNAVNRLTYSPDGRWLASTSNDPTVSIGDADTGQLLLALNGHTASTTGVSFSPDGRRLASASYDGTALVWDAASGKKLFALKAHTASVRGVSFSPDGRRLATASEDQTVRIWDTASGKELFTLKGHTAGVVCVSFSPDGRQLASASIDKTVRVWDADTFNERFTLKGHTGFVMDVSFSPDGQRLASASMDHSVRVWDVATGKELLVLKGHKDAVWGVSFSPDGRRLASGSKDQTVRVWDTNTGKELLALKGHVKGVAGVAFSPDGRRLASASDDQTMRVWEAYPVPDTLWRQRLLVSQVASLFEKLVLREKVLIALRQETTLDEADRKTALEVAQSYPEDPSALNETAWNVAKLRDAGKEAYTRALHQAEAAARLAPENGQILNTLGVAQYRAGRYADALATLTKSEKLNATKEGSLPEDLAFLALAQHQMNKKDEAKATLDRLREVMKLPGSKTDTQAIGFLREAEELIENKPGEKPSAKK